jgi:hypothetical protein
MMDLVAADPRASPRGGSRARAGGRCGGGSDTLDVGHGDGGRARTRCMVGSGDGGWPSTAITSWTTPLFRPLAIETYGCIDSAFGGFLGTCARRAAELRAEGFRRISPIGIQICLLLSV